MIRKTVTRAAMLAGLCCLGIRGAATAQTLTLDSVVASLSATLDQIDTFRASAVITEVG
jgi:hypothetical protein